MNYKISVETSKQAKKTDNLRKNENVYFCIDDPNPPYKGVRGKVSAKIHGYNRGENYGQVFGEFRAQALLDMQKKGQSVVLEISPKYYSTWDYSIDINE